MRKILILAVISLFIVSGCASPRQFGRAVAFGLQDFSQRMKESRRENREDRKVKALEDIGSGVNDIGRRLRW